MPAKREFVYNQLVSDSSQFKEASAAILLSHDSLGVLWAQRNPTIKFLGGFHAFPGGKLDEGDSLIEVRNASEPHLTPLIVSAVREVFEEVGLLLVQGGEKLTKGQRASLHDDLVSGRSTFAEILDQWNLWIDATDFSYVGFWTTPKFSPLRFKTHFFLARCPRKQQPYSAIGEMIAVEFVNPAVAVERWKRSEVLMSPPVLVTLQELAVHGGVIDPASEIAVTSALKSKSDAVEGEIHFVEINPHTFIIPLKTKTLPPATHTNCFVLGRKEFVVVDAASPELDEQARLHSFIDRLIEAGGICKEIYVSHLHSDHFGGEQALKRHLLEMHGLDVPVVAHRSTAESLDGKATIDRVIDGDETLDLINEDGEAFVVDVLHTPGHARGHLCFYDQSKGFLISCDNVINTGSVVIAPPEGNMTDYIHSLERMKALPGLKSLCGSHGTAVYDAKRKIDTYIEHRLQRERQILAAWNSGIRNVEEIVEKIYVGLDPTLVRLAIKSVEAHIEKLKLEGALAA